MASTSGNRDKGEQETTAKKPWGIVIAALIAAVGSIIVALISLRGSQQPPTPTPEPITSKYSFEEGVMGWVTQTYTDSQACVQVLQSDKKAHEGRFSLAMHMDLVGGDPDDHKRKGEAWVDMRSSPPSGGEAIPIDLTNRRVTVQVYAPQGARGDEKHLNGFQIFVKDEKFKSLYGPWDNVTEGRWKQIVLTVSNSTPEGGYKDPDFDPSQIIVVGVKMGAGDGSTETYKGLVYVDRVNWN